MTRRSKKSQTRARRFVLHRLEDVSGVSGTGVVAEGVRFSNGQVVLHWLSQLSCVAVYSSTDILLEIHGHEGRTRLEWIDPDPNPQTEVVDAQ